MAQVLIAVATLMMTFVLATIGAYTGYYSVKRTEYVTKVNGSMSRLLSYTAMTAEDLQRLPKASDMAVSRFSRESGDNLTYSYGDGVGYFWICASSPYVDYRKEAFERVQALRPADTVIGDATCDSAGGPSATNMTLTMRVR